MQKGGGARRLLWVLTTNLPWTSLCCHRQTVKMKRTFQPPMLANTSRRLVTWQENTTPSCNNYYSKDMRAARSYAPFLWTGGCARTHNNCNHHPNILRQNFYTQIKNCAMVLKINMLRVILKKSLIKLLIT